MLTLRTKLVFQLDNPTAPAALNPAAAALPAAPANGSLVAAKYGKWKNFEEDSEWMNKIPRLNLFC